MLLCCLKAKSPLAVLTLRRPAAARGGVRNDAPAGGPSPLARSIEVPCSIRCSAPISFAKKTESLEKGVADL
jgi:hypothetical protein